MMRSTLAPLTGQDGKLQFHGTSFHSTCTFIKEQSEAASQLSIRAFPGGEKKSCGRIAFHDIVNSMHRFDVTCGGKLIKKGRKGLSLGQGRSLGVLCSPYT